MRWSGAAVGRCGEATEGRVRSRPAWTPGRDAKGRDSGDV